MMKQGSILESTSLLEGSYFENSRIFVAEYNEKGAIDFIVNRPFARSLNELIEFRHSPSFPLYEGGPVDQEHLFLLHRRPDLVGEGKEILGKITLGGSMNDAIKNINNKTLTTADIYLFIGYCGWNSGELEAEIKEGSWTVKEQADLFSGGNG